MEINYDLDALAQEPEPTTVGNAPLTPEIVDESENLPAIPDFPTQDVAGRLLHYEQEVALMVQRSRAITIIKDQDTNSLAVTMGLQAKKLAKNLETLRKYYVEPHNKFLRTVNNFFKRYTDPLTEIEKTLGRKVGAYRQLQENERRRQEAEAAAATRELQKKLEEEAAQAAAQDKPFEPVTVVAPILPEVAKVTRTEEGAASQRRKWVCVVVNADLVPREYCAPVQTLLNKAVTEGGVREIPGCEIKEEFITGFRC